MSRFDPKRLRSRKAIVGWLLLCLNTPVWRLVELLGDVQVIVDVGAWMRNNVHLIRDWGWVAGLVWLGWLMLRQRPVGEEGQAATRGGQAGDEEAGVVLGARYFKDRGARQAWGVSLDALLTDSSEAWAAWESGNYFTYELPEDLRPKVSRLLLLHPHGEFLDIFLWAHDRDDKLKFRNAIYGATTLASGVVRWSRSPIVNIVIGDPNDESGWAIIQQQVPHKAASEWPCVFLRRRDDPKQFDHWRRVFLGHWEQGYEPPPRHLEARDELRKLYKTYLRKAGERAIVLLGRLEGELQGQDEPLRSWQQLVVLVQEDYHRWRDRLDEAVEDRWWDFDSLQERVWCFYQAYRRVASWIDKVDEQLGPEYRAGDRYQACVRLDEKLREDFERTSNGANLGKLELLRMAGPFGPAFLG